jgi:hypothetical protein
MTSCSARDARQPKEGDMTVKGRIPPVRHSGCQHSAICTRNLELSIESTRRAEGPPCVVVDP